MGQTPSASLPPDVRDRVKAFKVDEILSSERLLKQATIDSTTAYSDFNFTVLKLRGDDEEGADTTGMISSIGFWHLGHPVDLSVATMHSESHEPENLLADEGCWSCKSDHTLSIRFERAVAVSEFAFRTHPDATAEQDIVRFRLSATKTGTNNWLTLWESEDADFATPAGRGAWAPRVELGDKAVSVETVGAKPRQNFAEATEKYAAASLQGWLSGSPTAMSPAAQTRALMECCKAQIVGESQRRREALFSMLYCTSEAAIQEASEAAAERRLKMRAQSAESGGGTGIASLAASCGTRLLLESGLQGPQSEMLLSMLNDQITAGVEGLDLPPPAGVIAPPLAAALETASTVCRDQLRASPMSGIRHTLGTAFRDSGPTDNDKVELTMLRTLLVEAGDLSEAEAQKLIQTARDSLDVRAGEKHVNYHDFLDWLCADNGKATKRLAGLTRLKCPSPKVAELLLRLAGIRGSFGDALAAAQWLMNAPDDVEMDGLWKGAENLFSLLSAWSKEYYDEDKMWTNLKTVSAAMRCYAPLAGQEIRSLGPQGTFAEVRLEAGASKCRIGFVPVGALWKEEGVGLQNGEAWMNGARSPLEENNLQRALMDGDVVGLHMLRGKGVDVYLNGQMVGRLPWNPELELKGCHLTVCDLHSQAAVHMNIGQTPFEFPVAGVESWCATAGKETFEQARAAAVEDALGKAPPTVLGVMIMRTLARNCASVTTGALKEKAKKIFESAHNYANNTHEIHKVEIPNAKSYKITWDPRTRMENECDYVSFFLDEGLTKRIGKAKYTASGGPGSVTCPELVIEAERFWFLWHTDGSNVDWGWKMTVEAEVKSQSNAFPLRVQADEATIQTMTEMLQPPVNNIPPSVVEALLHMIPKHVNLGVGAIGDAGESVAASLLSLARESGDIAVKGAKAFGECCAALLGSPEALLRAQLQLWSSMDQYSPEALSIVSSNIASADMPFWTMVDNPDTPEIVEQLVALIQKEPSNPRVPKCLWRICSDGVAYLVAGRSKNSAQGWSVILRSLSTVFQLAAGILDASPASSRRPLPYLQVLVMPALHGLALIPSLSSANWDDVVGMLPCVGELFSKGAAYPSLRTGALALITTLAFNLASIGKDINQADGPPAKDALKVLQSPLVRSLPTSALGDGYSGPPLGVQMVEETIGLPLRVKGDGIGANPVLQEMMDLATPRAKMLVEQLEIVEPNPNKNFLPVSTHCLVFCLLSSRFHAVDTLRKTLDEIAAGRELLSLDEDGKAVIQLWAQARRLGFPWLLNVKQRLNATGRDPEVTNATLEQSLRMLVSAEPPEVATDPGEDDGLSAMWEQQGRLGGEDLSLSVSMQLSPKWGSVTKKFKDLKRLNLLLQPIPKETNHLPAQQIREFFDSQWIEQEDPIEFLLRGIRAASIAAWRRAAGISLLAWAVRTCCDGAESWVAGLALNAMGRAWEEEAALPPVSVEAPAITALAVARRYALESMVRFLVAAEDGRSEGPALQVMCLAGMAGPWHQNDQSIAMAANVFGALRPHLPWVGGRTPHDKRTLRKLRGHAARLALESLTVLSQGEGRSAAKNPLLDGMLAELYSDLALHPATGAASGDKNAVDSASLKALFGADAVAKQDKKKEPPPPEGSNQSLDFMLADLRRRLHAGEDFGTFPEEYWEDYLQTLKDNLADWGDGEGRRSVADLVAQMQGGDDEAERIDWAQVDVNGDGFIDRYEVLRVVRQMMGLGSDSVEIPTTFPQSFPRYVGDTCSAPAAEEEEDPGPPCFLQSLAVPSTVGVPTCALLMSLDSLLRATQTAASAGPECSDAFCEKLLELTSGGSKEALFSLSILRHRPSLVSEGMVGRACKTLIASIAACDDPGWLRSADAPVAFQRAAVLRNFLAASGDASNHVQDLLSGALNAGKPQVLAALYVISSPPLCHALASARVSEGNHDCTVVDATGRGPVWSFHEHMDSPGNDIEHVGPLDVETLKEKCLEKKGVCFNTQGWIKRSLRDPLVYWTEQDGQGLYVLEHKYAPVMVLRNDGTGVSEVEPGSVQMLSVEADLSGCSAEVIRRIVDASKEFGMRESAGYNHSNWALRAALRQSSVAADHFVASGGFAEWLQVAFRQSWPSLEDMSPGQRSAVAASVRLDFVKQFKKGADAVFEAGSAEKAKEDEPEDEAAEQEAKETDSKGASIVALAISVLGMAPLPPAGEGEKEGIPTLEKLTAATRSALQRPPTSRVPRVSGFLPDTDPAVAVDRLGMVDGNPKAQAAGGKDSPVEALLDSARKDKATLDSLAKEAAVWEHHTLAVDVCYHTLLHMCKTQGGADQLAQLPADRLPRLCLMFHKSLVNDEEQAQARAAMLTLVSQRESIMQGFLESAVANFLGSLGSPPGAVAGPKSSQTMYESDHPYANYTDKREDVCFPGARRIVITFDQQSTTEENCDWIDFTAPTMANSIRRTGGNRGQWSDIVIEGDRFSYHWHTDHSVTRWGWIFTCKPEGLAKKTKSADPPDTNNGLYLLEILLDALPSFSPEVILRPEIAALLLGLVEMDFGSKLVDLLQRFIALCKEHAVALEWGGAAHTLQALIQRSQAANQKDALASAVSLRLALPEVKVPSSLPRFKQAQGVYLSEQDQVCISRSSRKMNCYVATRATAVCFTRLNMKETWVGLAKAGESVMIRLTDGATSDGAAIDTSQPIDSAALREVRVQFNKATSTVTFEGSNFTRCVDVPAVPLGDDAKSAAGSVAMESRGGWRFAVRLCELSSSAKVSLPLGLSSTELTTLCVASDAVQAVSTYRPATEWPQDFLLQAFCQWYDARKSLHEPPEGVQESEEGELSEVGFVAWGAGIEDFNGHYRAVGEDDEVHHDHMKEGCCIFANENQCYFYCRLSSTAVDEGDGMLDNVYVFARSLDPAEPPVYLSTYKQDNQTWRSTLCFPAQETSGAAPVILNTFLFEMHDCADLVSRPAQPPPDQPPADDSPPEEAYDFEVIQVVERRSRCLAVLYKTGSRNVPLLKDGERKTITSVLHFPRVLEGLGLVLVQFSPHRAIEKVYFSGSAEHNDVLIHTSAKKTTVGLVERLMKQNAVPIESSHPLSANDRNVTKLTADGGEGITIQFNNKSQLPSKMIAMVTADEAGKQPLRLTRNKHTADALGFAATKRANDDASRGIISAVRGQSYQVQASECYLHYPLPRPVSWDVVWDQACIVEKSKHPYDSNADVKKEVCLKGAQRLRVQFHCECWTKGGYDYLRFYSDEACSDQIHSFCGDSGWNTVEIPGERFWYTFWVSNRPLKPIYWGFEFQVSDASLPLPTPPGGMLKVKENEYMQIPNGVRVKRAWYGAPSEESRWRDEMHHGKMVTEKILVWGEGPFTFQASNANFTDPVPGRSKILLVEVESVEKSEASSLFLQGVNLADDGSLVFEGAPAPTHLGWASFPSPGMDEYELFSPCQMSEDEVRQLIEESAALSGYVKITRQSDEEGSSEVIKLIPAGCTQGLQSEFESASEPSESEPSEADGGVHVETYLFTRPPLDTDLWVELPNWCPNTDVEAEHRGNFANVEAAKQHCKAVGCVFFTYEPLLEPQYRFFKRFPEIAEGFPGYDIEATEGCTIYRLIPGERDTAPYTVRSSSEALSWLPSTGRADALIRSESGKRSAESRCKVLAGEISIDFASAPIEEANLAIGVAVKPKRKLMWPPPAPERVPAIGPAAAPGAASEAGPGDGPPLALPPAELERAGSAPMSARFSDGAYPPRPPSPSVSVATAAASVYGDVSRYGEEEGDEQKLEWWWRCDGETHTPGGGTKLEPEAWNFGAGDVIGVLALLDGLTLYALRLTRSGHTVSTITFPNGGLELPDIGKGKDHCLTLCVGVRRSPACVSLSPTPKDVVPVMMLKDAESAPLTKFEQASATVVFHALDASKDGSLDRGEISSVLGGCRDELFEALDSSASGLVTLDEWHAYLSKVKAANGVHGLALFVDSFRKKLSHVGLDVAFPDAPPPKESWGLHITTTPTVLTTECMLKVIKAHLPEYFTEFETISSQSWERSSDTEIVAFLDWLRGLPKEDGCENSDDLERFMQYPKERKSMIPSTAGVSRILARAVAVKTINDWVENRLMPFTDLAAITKHSFSRPISKARHLLFKKLKYSKFDAIVQETFTNDEMEMTFQRQPKIDLEQEGGCDIEGTKMLFAQASLKAEGVSNTLFRSRAPNYNRVIKVRYDGEDGVDQGGLYRDFLAAIATELMSRSLPLFIPTPNGRDNKGECREAWTLAPCKPTAAMHRMLRFLGRMMSICIRRGDVIPLTVSSFTWKLLIGETPSLDDLAKADVNTAHSIQQLQNLEAMGVTEEEFQEVFGDLYFVYPNSNNDIVPLVEGGERKAVTFQNAPEFANAVLQMRINEAAESVAVIRDGMAGAVPIGCFSLWQYQDLEFRVCGNPVVDLAQLRRHVRYDGYAETDEPVKFLWQALEQFAQQDLQFFIRFCWGRSRLPPEGSAQWGAGFKVAKATDIAPTALPRAHTCFFKLDLPQYTSAAVAHDRLLYAVRHCRSMLIS